MSKSQTAGLRRRFIKNNLTQRGSHIMRSLLMSHMQVSKIYQKDVLWTFSGF